MPLPEPEADACKGYLEWVRKYFPHVCTAPFGERHIRLWDWFDGLIPGVKPEPIVEVWPRGSAKSSTAEMAAAYLGVKGTRGYLLYVSGTQEQADKHVAAIASLLERIGIDRSLNKYGHSKGWRRNQLRCSNGFTVEALGLDTAARGIKIDERRPDIEIFDDVDDETDTPKTVEKKLRSIKSKIIPAGSSDCAVVFVQNLVHEPGIVCRLADGRADFLLTRKLSQVEVAVEGLEVESVDRGDGLKVYRVVAGKATWAGQSLETCEAQINEWSLETFLREAQQEVHGADGSFFNHKAFEYAEALPLDLRGFRFCRGWDLAATEGGKKDCTVGTLMARSPVGIFYVIDVVRGRWGPDNVEKKLLDCAREDRKRFGPGVRIRIPQDPAQAGKYQAVHLERLLTGFQKTIESVSGSKATRAFEYAKTVNIGNVRLLREDWNWAFVEEHRLFREDEEHEFDDQVDAAADAFNELGNVREWRVL